MDETFADAADVIFEDESRSEEATYFEDDEADGVEGVRIIRRHFHETANAFETGAIVPGDGLWVRQSEVPAQPPEGARFVLGDGTVLSVRTAQRDELDVKWVCDVDQIPPGS